VPTPNQITKQQSFQNRKEQERISLYLSLYVLELSVCSDFIVSPLSLFYSLLSTRLSDTLAFQVLDIFSA